jgi:hypothetical protein
MRYVGDSDKWYWRLDDWLFPEGRGTYRYEFKLFCSRLWEEWRYYRIYRIMYWFQNKWYSLPWVEAPPDEHLACSAYPNCDIDPMGCCSGPFGDDAMYGFKD